MTPDESAWTLYAEELRKRGHVLAADAAIAMLAELRKRRLAGAFGPQGYENERGNLDADLSRPAPMEYGRKTYADIQCERDAARGQAKGAARSVVFLERQLADTRGDLDKVLKASGRVAAERDEQRARAEAAEREDAKLVRAFRDEFAEAARWGDAQNLTPAECAIEWMRKGQVARALLKEALGALWQAWHPALTDQMPSAARAEAVLTKAKAASYGVEP